MEFLLAWLGLELQWEESFSLALSCMGFLLERYVRHHLSLKVQQVAMEVEEVLEVLQGEGQTIWTIIRSRTLMKLYYHFPCVIHLILRRLLLKWISSCTECWRVPPT